MSIILEGRSGELLPWRPLGPGLITYNFIIFISILYDTISVVKRTVIRFLIKNFGFPKSPDPSSPPAPSAPPLASSPLRQRHNRDWWIFVEMWWQIMAAGKKIREKKIVVDFWKSRALPGNHRWWQISISKDIFGDKPNYRRKSLGGFFFPFSVTAEKVNSNRKWNGATWLLPPGVGEFCERHEPQRERTRERERASESIWASLSRSLAHSLALALSASVSRNRQWKKCQHLSPGAPELSQDVAFLPTFSLFFQHRTPRWRDNWLQCYCLPADDAGWMMEGDYWFSSTC